MSSALGLPLPHSHSAPFHVFPGSVWSLVFPGVHAGLLHYLICPPTPPLPETYLPSQFLALPSAPSHYLIPSLPWAPTATSSAVSVHYIQAQRLAYKGHPLSVCHRNVCMSK